MSSGRPAKRARKKQNRTARRDEWRRAVQKRRRKRWGVFLGSLGVVGIGIAIAYFGFIAQPQSPSATPATPTKCGEKVRKSPEPKKKEYSKPKDQKLDPDKTYVLHMETSCGDIDIELDVKESPKTSNSVVFLVRERFYDGLVFHRILKGFVLQGGDPLGNGSGGPGYDVVEPPPEKIKYEEGVVAMAKGGPDPAGTSGSQFFIVSGEGGSTLPPDYAYLGKVIDGEETVDKIESFGNEQDGPPPTAWVYIERATIVES